MNNFILREKKRIILASLLFMIALIMISYQLYSYVGGISFSQNNLKEERLKEMTFQGASHARNIMKSYIDYIQGLSYKLSKHDDINQDAIKDFLKDITRGTQFQLIKVDIFSGDIEVGSNSIISGDSIISCDSIISGDSYFSDGEIDKIRNFSRYKDINNKSFIVTDVIKSGIDNRKSIEIISPIIRKDNDRVVGAVRGILYSDALGRILNTMLFNGEGFCNLFDSNGEYLSFSDNNVLLFQENYFDTMGKVSFDNGYSFDQIKSDVANKRQYFSAYSYNGNQRYSYSMPIEISNWYYSLIVPKWVINQNTVVLEQRAVSMAVQIGLMLVMIASIFAFIIYLFNPLKGELLKYNEELIIKEKEFNFIFEKSKNIIFEYVISNGVIKFSKRFEELLHRKPIEEGFPYIAIEKGAIHHEYAADLLKMFDSLKRGVPSASAEIRLKDGFGNYIWCLISAVSIFNDKDILVKSIGIVEIINDKKEIENKYNEILKYKSAIDSGYVFKCDINLTKNYYISGYEEILSKANLRSENNYLKILRLMARDYFNIEDMNEFMHKNNPNNLISLFLSGIANPAFEYRITESDNAEKWLYFKYKIYESPTTLDTCAVVSISDISVQKRKEAELIDKAEKDQMTGLYNKTTTEKLIKEWIHTHENSFGGLMIIDIDDFKKVNDRFGHLYGDTILKKLAEGLKSIFRANDIVGRIGGDEFFVFLKKVSSEKIIIEKAKEISELFHKVYEGKNTSCEISASVGIALSPKHGKVLEVLYKNADKALYASKEKGKNTFTVYNDENMQVSSRLPEFIQKSNDT